MIKESDKTIDISDGNRISDNTVLNEKIELESKKLLMQNAERKSERKQKSVAKNKLKRLKINV
jgi:hypothetical protein